MPCTYAISGDVATAKVNAFNPVFVSPILTVNVTVELSFEKRVQLSLCGRTGKSVVSEFVKLMFPVRVVVLLFSTKDRVGKRFMLV